MGHRLSGRLLSKQKDGFKLARRGQIEMEIEPQAQISCQSCDECPPAFAGSLPVFPRILQTAKNDSTVKLKAAFVSNSTMSAAERSQAADTPQEIEYTVKQTAKIHQEKQRDSRSSVWLSVAKCIVGFFLFASVLTCLVASKVSLLSMASIRRADKDAKNNRETLFIMVVLALMIPESFSFLKACWTSLLRKNHRWPCKKAIFVVRFL